MFKRVMKEKGLKIFLYVFFMMFTVVAVLIPLMWFMILEEYRTWDYFWNEIKYPQMMLIMIGFFTVILIPVSYSMHKSNLQAEDRVKHFNELYKVGDQFWAYRVKGTYELGNPRSLLNNIFHFKVEEINLKKTYFKLSEQYRSDWTISRSGMSDYHIFKSEEAYSKWLEELKKEYEDHASTIVESFEGVTP